MADQLRLDVSVQGGAAALAQLDALDARLKGLPQAAQATGAAATQAASQATAAAAQRVAATDRIAAADQKLRDLETQLTAEFEDQAARRVQAADRAAQAQERLVTRGNVVLGAALGAAAGGLATGLADAVREGANFERTFAEVQVVSQATAAQMDQMQQAALRLGASTTFNSQQVAGGLRELLQAGLTVNETLQAIEPSIRAAMLAGQGLDTTTNMIAHTMRQFGLDASQVPHIVDAMTVAAQGSTLKFSEFGDLFENLRGRTQKLGISFEEVTALEMAMVNAGVPARDAGTAIGTAIDRLSKATVEGTDEASRGLRELGVSVFDTQGRFVGFSQGVNGNLSILDQLAAKLPTMTQQEQAHALSLLGGARASGAFNLTLSQQANVMQDGNEVTLRGNELIGAYIDQLLKANGVSQRAADTINNTAVVAWQHFTASVQESQIQVGVGFLGAIEGALPPLTALVNQFVTAPPAIHGTTAAILAATTATVGASAAVVAGAAAWGLVGTAVTAAAVAMTPVLLPIAAVGAASAALAVAWVNDWGNIRETTADVASRLQTDAQGIGAALDGLGTQAHAAATEVSTALAGIGTSLGLGGVGEAFSNLGANAQAAGVTWGTAFKVGVTQALPAGGLFVAIEEWLHGQGQQAQAAAAEEGMRIGADFASNVAAALLAESPTLTDAWGGVADRLVAEFEGRGFSPEQAHAAARLYMGAVQDELERQRPGITAAAAGAGEAIADGLESAQGLVGAAAQDLATTAGAILAGAKGNIQQAVTEALRVAADAQFSPNATASLVTEMEQEANAARALTRVLGTLTPAERTQYDIELARSNATTVLNDMLAAGTITQEQYTSALERGSVGLERQTSAHTAAAGATRDQAAALREAKAAQDALNAVDPDYQQNLILQKNATAALTEAMQGLTVEQQASLVAQKNAGDLYGAVAHAFELQGLSANDASQAIYGLAHAHDQLAAAADRAAAATKQVAGIGGGGIPWSGPPVDFTGRQIGPGNPTILGANIASGIAAGLDQSAPQVNAAMDRLLAGTLAVAQTAIDAHSPSRVYAEQVGEPIGEGIAQGAESGLTISWPHASALLARLAADMPDETLAAWNAEAAQQLFREAGENVARQLAAGIHVGGIYLEGAARDAMQQVIQNVDAMQANIEASLEHVRGAAQSVLTPSATAGNYGQVLQQALAYRPDLVQQLAPGIYRESQGGNTLYPAGSPQAEAERANLLAIMGGYQPGVAAGRTPLIDLTTGLPIAGSEAPGGRVPGLAPAATQAEYERQLAYLAQAQGAAAEATKRSTVQTQAATAATDQAATATGAATDAQAGLTKVYVDYTAGTGLATHAVHQLLGVYQTGSATAEAAAAAAQQYAQAIQQSWQAMQQTAEALRAGYTVVAGIKTAVGLTYGQIYGTTATQGTGGAGSTNLSPANLAPGSYYGLPVVSPVTGGSLRGYATGATVVEPHLLINARTGTTSGIMAERGPESIVPAGGGGVTLNVTVNASGVDALRDTRFWEQVVDQQLRVILKRRLLVGV